MYHLNFLSMTNADNGGIDAIVLDNVNWESLIDSRRERHVEIELDANGN